jgi:hypothetical protein
MSTLAKHRAQRIGKCCNKHSCEDLGRTLVSQSCMHGSITSRLSMLLMNCSVERSANTITPTLCVRLHDSVLCMPTDFLSETHVKQTIHSYYVANHSGSRCIPTLLPHSLNQPLHAIFVVCTNCYPNKLLSPTLTRLCEPLRMGRQAVSLVPKTYPIVS